MITFTAVSFQYERSAPILVDISASFGQVGRSVALLGPSGSGKSTLLALAGGLLKPTSGTVDFVSGHRGKPSTSWIQQTTNVFGNRSAIENVAMADFAFGTDLRSATAPALSALQHVGLGSLASRKVSSLSGGEVQRVVIARAIAARSDLILADEPTGQLDAATTEVVLDALFSTVSTGQNSPLVIVATHDERVAQRCDCVVEVVNGSLVATRGSI
jgi:ABC-type lipoprotein export system ATPase subunit